MKQISVSPPSIDTVLDDFPTLNNLSIDPMKVLYSPEYDSITGKPIVTGEPDISTVYVVPYEVTKDEGNGSYSSYTKWIEWVYSGDDFIEINSFIPDYV